MHAHFFKNLFTVSTIARVLRFNQVLAKRKPTLVDWEVDADSSDGPDEEEGEDGDMECDDGADESLTITQPMTGYSPAELTHDEELDSDDEQVSPLPSYFPVQDITVKISHFSCRKKLLINLDFYLSTTQGPVITVAS